jgi:teichuronic acid biosynthesis glycosyltransferase TuaC
MRVLAVTNMYPTAASPWVGTFVEQQVEGLRRLGVEVKVLCLQRRYDGVDSGTMQFLFEGVRVYGGAGARIRRLAVEFRPEIVHVMYGGVMAEIATRALAEWPIVVSFCGGDLLGEPAKRLAKRLSIRYGVLASHIAARKADGIVVKSSNLRAALPSWIDRKKVWTIPNGVDLDLFKPMDPKACREQIGWREGPFHLLFPSFPENLCKGFDLAREAVDRLAASGMMVELHTLRDRPHREIPVWLNACDCLLLTSHLEGSPNIVKEALACDRGVVSVDVGDVRQRLAGIPGCFVTSRTAGDLAAKLCVALAGNGADGNRVQGRIRIQELSLERIAERLLDVYREVVKRRAASESLGTAGMSHQTSKTEV